MEHITRSRLLRRLPGLLTLFVGVVCSLLTAGAISRWMVTMVGQSHLGQKLHLFGVHQDAIQ